MNYTSLFERCKLFTDASLICGLEEQYDLVDTLDNAYWNTLLGEDCSEHVPLATMLIKMNQYRTTAVPEVVISADQELTAEFSTWLGNKAVCQELPLEDYMCALQTAMQLLNNDLCQDEDAEMACVDFVNESILDAELTEVGTVTFYVLDDALVQLQALGILE